MKRHVKIAITGAAGQIGYSLIFRIAAGALFGRDTTIDLHLIELEASLPSLKGVAMELQDCAFSCLRNVICTSQLEEGFKDVDFAVLVGAVPRKKGMERADLISINAPIFKKQGKMINDYANPDVRVLVVGNPCNTNCLIAMHSASDIPRRHFFAMTTLDENRAIAQLAEHAGALPSDVKDVIIWGNHSVLQYPDCHHATIKGNFVTDLIPDRDWLENDFIKIVQQRGAEVIKARGASSAASAANAVLNALQHITCEARDRSMFSMALCSQGEYGIDSDLMFSYPCRRNAQGEIEVVENLELSKFAKEKLAQNLEELRQEKQAVSAMGLL